MNIDSIKQLLGLTTDDGKVRALLEDLGVTSAPRLPPDDTDVNVERKDLGLYVVLTDDAFFHGKENAPIGVGPLILTNVTVYCAPTPDFEAFTGALPFGLDPSDDQEAARRKLGKPELSIARRNLDRWTIDGLWVFLQYSSDLKSISDLSIQVPDAS